MRSGIDVDPMLQRGDRRRHGARSDLQPVRTTRDQRLLLHPHQMRGELVGKLGALLRIDEEIAAREVDLVGEGQRHGIAGRRPLEWAVKSHDLLYPRLPPRAHDKHRIPRLDRARGNGAGEAAEISARPIDPLHRKAERLRIRVVPELDRLQMIEERRSTIPRRARRKVGHVVAKPRRDRDYRQRGEIEIGREPSVFLGDTLEHCGVEIEEVELIDRKHDVPDAQQ
jgi:hypothetical protein